MSMFDDVKEFHRFFGHPISQSPKMIDLGRLRNRLKWQDEERKEFDDALINNDLVELGDALVDQVYFILGTAAEMGIPFDKIWDVVHAANMRKAHYFRHHDTCPLNKEHEVPTLCNCGAVQYKPDGKTAKPEGWTDPNAEIRIILGV